MLFTAMWQSPLHEEGVGSIDQRKSSPSIKPADCAFIVRGHRGIGQVFNCIGCPRHPGEHGLQFAPVDFALHPGALDGQMRFRISRRVACAHPDKPVANQVPQIEAVFEMGDHSLTDLPLQRPLIAPSENLTRPDQDPGPDAMVPFRHLTAMLG